MKIVKLNQTYQHKNAENCVATEYDFADKAIDFSTARIVGGLSQRKILRKPRG